MTIPPAKEIHDPYYKEPYYKSGLGVAMIVNFKISPPDKSLLNRIVITKIFPQFDEYTLPYPPMKEKWTEKDFRFWDILLYAIGPDEVQNLDKMDKFRDIQYDITLDGQIIKTYFIRMWLRQSKIELSHFPFKNPLSNTA